MSSAVVKRSIVGRLRYYRWAQISLFTATWSGSVACGGSFRAYILYTFISLFHNSSFILWNFYSAGYGGTGSCGRHELSGVTAI